MPRPGDSPDLASLQRRVDESVGTIKRVFEAASDCMVIISAESGRFMAANPAFEVQSGYEFVELQWMHLWEIWRPDMVEEARSVFRKIVESGSGSQTEVPLLKKDGSIITAEFASRTMRYQGQDALLSIVVDITPRKEAERHASQMQGMRESLQVIEAKAKEALGVADSLDEELAALRGELSAGGTAAPDEQVARVTSVETTLRHALDELLAQAHSALTSAAETEQPT